MLERKRHLILDILNAWVKVGDLQRQICFPLPSRLLQALGETIFVRVRGQKNTGFEQNKTKTPHDRSGSLRRDFPSQNSSPLLGRVPTKDGRSVGI